jgi:hypothetical protein
MAALAPDPPIICRRVREVSAQLVRAYRGDLAKPAASDFRGIHASPQSRRMPQCLAKGKTSHLAHCGEIRSRELTVAFRARDNIIASPRIPRLHGDLGAEAIALNNVGHTHLKEVRPHGSVAH